MSKGFTLVELLVVVTIIGILSTIGIVVFSDAQKNARDGRRRADIESIANAIESAKAPGTVVYSPITDANFSSNTIPTDNGSVTDKPNYCIRVSTTLDAIADPTEDEWSISEPCVTTDWSPFDAADITSIDKIKLWKVCARLENAPNKIFCKGSAQ